MRARVRPASLLALAGATLSLCAPAAASGQSASLAFTQCHPIQVIVRAAGLQCATLNVPFDRSDPAVGDIALAVQRVPASGPRVGVIVLLAGGPGQPALPAFEDLLAPLAHDPALRGYELVAFDQRGTGQSEALQCPEPPGSGKGGVTSYIETCGSALGPTRAFYSSQESVEDLNVLREALGGTPLSLFAVSYGGRVAGMYAREHPQGVARMVLDSPSPIAEHNPLNSQAVRALRRVLDEGICGAGACRSFSPDVYGDLTRLVATLHRHPLHTRIYDEHGRLRAARVTEAGVLHLLTALDLSHGARELAPAAISAAAHGDAAPLARLTGGLLGDGTSAAQAPESDSAIANALFTATYCIENDLPWSSDSDPSGRSAALREWLASLPAGITAPFAPATLAGAGSVISLCMGWPATPPAPPSPAGVSATPTLILSGADDLRTPYEQDLAILAGYSDAQLLKIPDTGHSTVSADLSGCAKKAMIEFIATGQAPASCPRSSEPQALPLPPASLSEVPATPSRSRVAGRVAGAAAMTIEDLLGQTSFSGGGLRGGYWALTPKGLVLHHMIDVPGVALSGTLRIRADSSGHPAFAGHVTVRGRLSGKLTLRARTVDGSIGGAKVHARIVAL